MQKLVLHHAARAALVVLFAVADPASGQPPGGPPGRGEIRNYEVDSERDFNLVRLKSQLDLTAEQREAIVDRYRKLRTEQTVVLQSVLRESEANRKGPPSPDRRALQETQLRKKIVP